MEPKKPKFFYFLWFKLVFFCFNNVLHLRVFSIRHFYWTFSQLHIYDSSGSTEKYMTNTEHLFFLFQLTPYMVFSKTMENIRLLKVKKKLYESYWRTERKWIRQHTIYEKYHKKLFNRCNAIDLKAILKQCKILDWKSCFMKLFQHNLGFEILTDWFIDEW